jgi:hypothetical protein
MQRMLEGAQYIEAKTHNNQQKMRKGFVDHLAPYLLLV